MSLQTDTIVPAEPKLSDIDIQDMLAKSVRLYADRAVLRFARPAGAGAFSDELWRSAMAHCPRSQRMP